MRVLYAVLRVMCSSSVGTKWFSNWKASLLCWASRGFPNRKLLGLINF